MPVFMGFGKLLESLTGELLIGISGNIFLGIPFLGILFTVFAFFIPLNLFIEIPVLIMGFGLFFYFKLYQDLHTFIIINIKLFLPFLIIILVFSSFYPFILDHFGYYVPTISWLSEVGITKGISNLDLLLGQMSFWHIFQAGFSNFSDPFLRMNALIMVFYLIYILEKKTWLHLLFFPILLLFIQSPSPDLPAIVFSLIVLNEIFLENKNTNLLFAVSIFVFAIKPTMIWVPIFVFLYSIFVVKSHLKFLSFGLIIFGLFIFKNIWTFGFPIFPVSVLDMNLSWKPNAELLKISSDIAIQKTYDMQYSVSDIEKFSTLDYINNWLFLSGIKGVIHWFFLFFILIFSIFAFKTKNKLHYLLWISIIIKCVLVLYFSAQYRFFIDVFFVVFFVLFYKIANRKVVLTITSVSVVFSLFLFCNPKILQEVIPSFKLGNFMSGFYKSQFIKPNNFELNKFTKHKIGNLEFYVVKDYPFSFDTPIPAISPEFLKEDYNAGIFPQKISEDVSDGFILMKLTKKDKQKLELILKKLEF